MIAAERARLSSSNCLVGDSLKIEDSVNFASDSVRKKYFESEARSSVRRWKCDRKGHKSFECPYLCKKRKKNVCGDAYKIELRDKRKQMIAADRACHYFFISPALVYLRSYTYLDPIGLTLAGEGTTSTSRSHSTSRSGFLTCFQSQCLVRSP